MKKIYKNISVKGGNRGFALVWALIMCLIFLIITTSMTILIVKELRITSNIDESNRAYMAAEAGMERALYYIKNQSFGWCPPGTINYGPITIDAALTYNYKIIVVNRVVAGVVTGCSSITIESTGVEKLETRRKIKLSIVYGPMNNIERFAPPPALPPVWSDATRNYYTFPASSLASNKPLIVQQFDIWDLQTAPIGQQLTIGMSSGNINDDFGVKVTRLNVNTAQMALTGKIGGINLLSSPQNFSIAGNPKFRIVTEYSRVSNNYSVVRSIVLLRDAASGEEKYNCPTTAQSFIVYGYVAGRSPDPTLVKVGFPTPAPNVASSAGNGYLQYSPGAVKVDNMVFWGRE